MKAIMEKKAKELHLYCNLFMIAIIILAILTFLWKEVLYIYDLSLFILGAFFGGTLTIKILLEDITSKTQKQNKNSKEEINNDAQ